MRATAAFLAGIVLVSCASEGGVFDPDIYDPIDRAEDLTREDYRNMTTPRGEVLEDGFVAVKKAPVPMPEIADILAAPKPPKIGRTKLVSLTVTDDVPLKDVLIELARLAQVDIELGSGIEGGVSFIAKDKPFSEVIARIADLAGLRYRMKNGVLRVEHDAPYVKNYTIDFLNMVRNSSSDVSLSTDILSLSASASAGGGLAGGGAAGGGGGAAGGGGGAAGGGGGAAGGLTTGTNTNITSQTDSDFWQALEASLLEVLNWQPRNQMMPAGAPQPINAAGGTGAQGANGTFYVINRQAGILSVAASERQHQRIAEYLELLKRNASAQVLIEAKIIEVELDEGFQSGIDWSAALGNSSFSVSTPAAIANGATFSLGGGGNNLGINLDSVVQLVESFGASRTLSSPRLHAIHNQQAVLTFAENQVFFEVQVQRQDPQIADGGVGIPGQTEILTTRRAVPIGIILNILPSINLDDNEVTLSVRPTITRRTNSVSDPGSAILNAELPADQQFVNEIPIVEVRELDSVMKVKSGNVMVIGGLMEEIGSNSDEGVPFLSGVPWLGNAFKSVSKELGKRELIIFIKATIVSTDGNHDIADEKIYDKFFDDARPLSF